MHENSTVFNEHIFFFCRVSVCLGASGDVSRLEFGSKERVQGIGVP